MFSIVDNFVHFWTGDSIIVCSKLANLTADQITLVITHLVRDC